MLYSTEDAHTFDGAADIGSDANTYRPFKLVDTIITRNIELELGLIDGSKEEGASLAYTNYTTGH